MKIRQLYSLLAILMLSCQADSGGEAKKEQLKSILADYYSAMSRKDLQKMNELTAPNFVFFDDGKIYNNETAVKSVPDIGQFVASFRIDSLNTSIDKLNASAYYLREADIKTGDSTYPTLRFLESATFVKKDGHWKLRFIHSSPRK